MQLPAPVPRNVRHRFAMRKLLTYSPGSSVICEVDQRCGSPCDTTPGTRRDGALLYYKKLSWSTGGRSQGWRCRHGCTTHARFQRITRVKEPVTSGSAD